MPAITTEAARDLETMLAEGAVEECPGCGKYSAYAWSDVDEDAGIAHISTCGGDEWQCGHCRTYWVDADSPLCAEVYTHVDPAVADDK